MEALRDKISEARKSLRIREAISFIDEPGKSVGLDAATQCSPSDEPRWSATKTRSDAICSPDYTTPKVSDAGRVSRVEYKKKQKYTEAAGGAEGEPCHEGNKQKLIQDTPEQKSLHESTQSIEEITPFKVRRHRHNHRASNFEEAQSNLEYSPMLSSGSPRLTKQSDASSYKAIVSARVQSVSRGGKREVTPAFEEPVHVWALDELVWAYNLEDQKWHRAVIIATEKPSYLLCDTATGGEPEAYIHWKGYDRRLDSWLPYSKLRKLNADDHRLETADEPLQVSGKNVAFDHNHMEDGHDGDDIDKEYLREHHENTKFKTIDKIQLGEHIVDCWYFSPYPPDVQNSKILYICQFCLSFFKHEIELTRHKGRCQLKHPPGYEIYRDQPDPKSPTICMWELDGSLARIYCENLSFLSKLFLDHKTLKHPVHLFLFYVITELQSDGYHIVGYFSKEKYSRNNVSCILIMPQHQKKGYGKYLINFSYALALKEGRRGTPERPLSDLGRVSYINYWRQCILALIQDRDHVILESLADELSFEVSDIVTTFNEAQMIYHSCPGISRPFLWLTEEFLEVLSATVGKPSAPVVPNKLRWIPYDPFLGPFEYIAD